ncbi:MAG TPA: DHH family phosphoesterase [Geopsychrobacteraceae bacterium]|nr:DHH family phosphoesterase [Geopsychrobacteraceae bacterium]
MVNEKDKAIPGCNGLSVSRDRAAAMIEWMRGRGRILIVTHDNPDPDAIAAAVALRHLLLVQTGQDAVVTFGGIIGRSENRLMVEELEIDLKPISTLDLEQFDIVCMVDTQPGTGNNSYPVGKPVHLVIDHHAPRAELQQVIWVDVREEYGAAATILYEYLCSQNIRLNTRLATSLYYAIKSETQDLGREWSKADREAYLKLLPISNNRILFRITHPPVPGNYFTTFNRAMKNARIYDYVLVFNLFEIDNPDIVAELADFMLRHEGVMHVMGLGWYDGAEVVSLRTLDPEIRLGQVVQKIFHDMGTSGGHGMTAGGQIRPMSSAKSAQVELEQLLTSRFLDIVGLKPTLGEPLVAELS